MLRFNRCGSYPRSLQHEKVHVVTTRNTLYGIHKNIIHPDYDMNCSKTVLLACFERIHAKKLISTIEHVQRRGLPIQREIQDDIVNLSTPAIYNSGFFPLSVEEVALPDLEQICLLHFFDMFVTFDLEEQDTDTLLLNCYEYKTYEIPNQGIIRRFMEDMYH